MIEAQATVGDTPHLSPTIASILLRQSPFHAWQHHRLGDNLSDEATAAKRQGSLFDRLLFGVGPEIVVVDAKDWRTNAAKEARDTAEGAGKLAVLAKKMEELASTVATVRESLEKAGVVFDGFSQVTQVWESDGVPCKGKLDHLCKGDTLIYDLKTCENASTEKITRSIVDYGGDIQHAAYVEGVEANNPDLAGRVKMAFVFVELNPPFYPHVRVKTLGGSMRSLGATKWARAKAIWGECLKTKVFPGYSDDGPIEATPWQMAAAMDPGGGVPF